LALPKPKVAGSKPVVRFRKTPQTARFFYLQGFRASRPSCLTIVPERLRIVAARIAGTLKPGEAATSHQLDDGHGCHRAGRLRRLGPFRFAGSPRGG
jgi:hypothetical protein